MKTFYLEILSPERVFYRGECVSLMLPISDGMLGIMANREPVTASIKVGEAKYTKPDGETVRFSVAGGMIEVTENKVVMLCDIALLPEEIDESKEEEAVRKAQLEMSKTKSRKEYQLSELMLSKAVNNLKVKKKTID